MAQCQRCEMMPVNIGFNHHGTLVYILSISLHNFDIYRSIIVHWCPFHYIGGATIDFVLHNTQWSPNHCLPICTFSGLCEHMWPYPLSISLCHGCQVEMCKSRPVTWYKFNMYARKLYTFGGTFTIYDFTQWTKMEKIVTKKLFSVVCYRVVHCRHNIYGGPKSK